ncbi:MAG TPA: hypothetical protein VGS57_16740 [Thermoanaerobaculia bacterium]|jgi:hypothetical protein|nr:hypothetical protein [Thermoanaerobaculia bacterium]
MNADTHVKDFAMFDRLATHPYAFSITRLRSRRPLIGDLYADLRIHVPETGKPQVLAAKVLRSARWNRLQPVYFEFDFKETSIDWVKGGPGAVALKGEINGYYWRPIADANLVVDGDFLRAPALPITMAFALNYSLPTPVSRVAAVTGTIDLHSEALLPEVGSCLIETDVVPSDAHLFARDLPAPDLAGQDYIYRVQLLPFLVSDMKGAPFVSAERLLKGTSIWQDAGPGDRCGIEIAFPKPDEFLVDSDIVAEIADGNLICLRSLLQTLGPAAGVPVAFVKPPFSTAGGETSGHGVDSAIVVVTDAVPDKNTTLLAHEIGHVLGGLEVGKWPVDNYWPGEPHTVMHAKNDVNQPPPSVIGEYACEHAKPFARWEPNGPPERVP